jgi:hypothetical protein
MATRERLANAGVAPHMYEMTTSQDPETEAGRYRYAAALAQWEDEGGAPPPFKGEAVSGASQGRRSNPGSQGPDRRKDAALRRRQGVTAGRRTAPRV